MASWESNVVGRHVVIQTPHQHQPTVHESRISKYLEGYMFKLHLDTRSSLADHPIEAVAIFLQAGSAGVPKTHPVLLVLKPCGAYYESVGITDWNNAWRCRYTDAHWESTSNSPVPSDLTDQFPKQTLYLT
jgi:hypothetical protein